MSDVKYDVVDLYLKLEKKFPHVDFITEDETENGKTIHRFKIRGLNGVEFNPPVKTTIFIEKNNELTKKEYKEIKEKMRISFGTRQLV